MLLFKSFKLGVSSAFALGAGLGWLRWVGRTDKLEEKLSTPAAGGHNQKLPTTDWARAVAMLAEMKMQEKKMESNRELH